MSNAHPALSHPASKQQFCFELFQNSGPRIFFPYIEFLNQLKIKSQIFKPAQISSLLPKFRRKMHIVRLTPGYLEGKAGGSSGWGQSAGPYLKTKCHKTNHKINIIKQNMKQKGRSLAKR
jgi:hypothetical protein